MEDSKIEIIDETIKKFKSEIEVLDNCIRVLDMEKLREEIRLIKEKELKERG